MSDGFELTAEGITEAVSEAWPGRPHVPCIEISPTHALVRQTVDQSGLRPGGFVPGPTQFSMADVALWYLAFGALGRIEPMALTSELSIRFLRPGQGETIWARADLDKSGRTTMVGTVRIWMDDRFDRLISTAQGTYAYPRDA